MAGPIRNTQDRLLNELSREPQTIKELSERFHVHRNTVQNRLKRLRAHGLVRSKTIGKHVKVFYRTKRTEPIGGAKRAKPSEPAPDPFEGLPRHLAACEELGIASTTLIRYANAYEKHVKLIPRDDKNHRRYTPEILDVFRGGMSAITAKVTATERESCEGTELFTFAPPFARASREGYGSVGPLEAEDLARRFIEQQPDIGGRRATTATMLAMNTGMTRLDALGALWRLEEQSDVRVFSIAGRESTFYTGAKYRPASSIGEADE